MEIFILQNFNTKLMEFYFYRIAIKNSGILFMQNFNIKVRAILFCTIFQK